MDCSLILYNASVLAMDDRGSQFEAVAVSGNRVLAVGANSDILNLAGKDTRRLDLQGRTLLPGFIDAHSHYFSYGFRKLAVDLSPESGVNDIGVLLQRVAQEVSKHRPGEWVRGTNYDQHHLKDGRHPSLEEMDRVAPDNPLVLYHYSGHAYLVNSIALAKAGITRDTPDPPGGEYERRDGHLTGLLKEGGMDRVKAIHTYTEDEMQSAARLSNSYYLENGVTSTHDMWVLDGHEEEVIRFMCRYIMEGHSKVRINLTAVGGPEPGRLGNIFLKTGLVTGVGNERLRIGPYKIFLDGTSDLGTAAFEEPYAAEPDNLGMLCIEEGEFQERVMDARRKGWQVSVHVIGDRAARIALDVFERCEAETDLPKTCTSYPYRLEHLCYVNPADISRLSRVRAQPILNPIFLSCFNQSYVDYVGEENRGKGADLIKTFLDAGLPAAAGSDCPICIVNPLTGVEYAITRQSSEGIPRNPQESIGLHQALQMFTINGAIASGEERFKGSIEPGKAADLVVLSENVQEVPPQELSRVKVKATLVDGEIVYMGDDFDLPLGGVPA